MLVSVLMVSPSTPVAAQVDTKESTVKQVRDLYKLYENNWSPSIWSVTERTAISFNNIGCTENTRINNMDVRFYLQWISSLSFTACLNHGPFTVRLPKGVVTTPLWTWNWYAQSIVVLYHSIIGYSLLFTLIQNHENRSTYDGFFFSIKSL